MVYIANRQEDIVSLKEISNTFKISDNHLSKILQRFVKAGYLISTKGPKGGFQIITRKKNATFMEIYETIEGKQIQKNCLFHSNPQECTQCIMSGLISKLNKDFYDYMKNHKLTDFKL